MSGADGRAEILAGIRAALGRGPLERARAAELQARLGAPRPGPVPARAQLDRPAQVELFVAMAEEAAATVTRASGPAEVPAAVAGYLEAEGLPAEVKMAPDPGLDDIPWKSQPLLRISRGPAGDADAVSLTAAFAGIAETGTCMLLSGPESPTGLTLLPETHIVVLRASQVVGPYEEAWARLRRRNAVDGAWSMPRTVSLITGPSRSADIEQTMQIGAHGPRRLHIVLVDGESGP
ncbi:MAG: lactate utilization protein [Proteobacteria bacterium]|nr:lactate utilization protein [Pseudomonadota bacterium]